VHQDLPKFNQLELISYLIETFQYAKLTIEKKKQVKIKIVSREKSERALLGMYCDFSRFTQFLNKRQNWKRRIL